MEKERIIYGIIFIGTSISVLLPIMIAIIVSIKKDIVKNKIYDLANLSQEITPRQFFEIRNASFGRKHISSDYYICGVYILFNISKNMYYVGQAQNVFDRVNNHFTGKGNGDVYADYKYGDVFTIKIIPLKNSGYYSLNDLERNTIMAYNSYSKGYNKTRGNK